MRQGVRFAAIVALAGAVGCGGGEAKNEGASPEAKPSAAAASAAPVASAAPAPSAEAPPPENSAAAAPVEPAAASAALAGSAAPAAGSAAPAAGSAAPASSAAAGPKTFDCGAKGQKPCPMQGWMKSVMASATSSGDLTKIANALAYIAGKPPPGMGSWVSISNEGVAKAKAGDLDGAKASCKKCHDLYKEKYKQTMRDLPW
ncbi:hypothetical protein [Polyangium mundeleinium]|uniref:Cytochrome c domain-containing protein n=1 Tax=Polyangium mundeleinium TaxID=2995306 RepID=A0ABT5EYY0_9BACT|nr:hypothetical protein [Polyangium mundeleinium]MDC0747047.1 hypothetical protein [Polyangium mundeleinium]